MAHSTIFHLLPFISLVNERKMAVFHRFFPFFSTDENGAKGRKNELNNVRKVNEIERKNKRKQRKRIEKYETEQGGIWELLTLQYLLLWRP